MRLGTGAAGMLAVPIKSAGVQRDLVFDIGMHRGEDTAYYLAKGYRVVGIEANPAMAGHCRARFAQAIESGRLRIVEGAVAPAGQRTVTFYRHPVATLMGTTDPDRVKRSSRVAEIEALTVPAVDVAKLLGTEMPWHLKVDIEGADRLCLDALLLVSEKPVTVSIEAEKVDFDALVASIQQLEALGYDRFAAVQQDQMSRKRISTFDLDGRLLTYQFEDGASGPFGPDISGWTTKDDLIRRYRRVFWSYRLLGDHALLNRSPLGFQVRIQLARAMRRPLPGWYDTHAARSA